MNERKYLFVLAGLLFFTLIPSGEVPMAFQEALNASDAANPQSATRYSPIKIYSNAELNAFCAGDGTDGTENNPHVIENYVIDISSEPFSNAIIIQNTNLYLIIQNCRITACGYSDEGNHPSIGLWNCSNVAIRNNVIANAYIGIYLESSGNNVVSNNNCSSNLDKGIYLHSSDNNRITDNNCWNNGIGMT